MAEKRYPQCILGACHTPWRDNYSLDERMFRLVVDESIAAGYTRMYVMGTVGEGYAVNDTQFRHVVDVFSEAALKPGLHPMVCVVSVSTAQIIDWITCAHKKGFRFFQVALPSWKGLSDSEVLTFFKTVCGQFPDSDFVHYNKPASKRFLGGEDYRPIIDAVPNFVGAKTSTFDMGHIRNLMVKAPEMQHFFLENAWPYACLYGEASLLCSYDLFFPDLTRKFFDAGRQGSVKEAFAIQERLMAVEEGLFASVTSDYIDGAWDKTFAWLKYPDFPMRLLPPYEGLTANEAKSARDYYEHQCGDLS